MAKAILWWLHVNIFVLIILLCVGKTSSQFVTVSCYECANCTDPFSSSSISATVGTGCNACYKMAITIAYAPYNYVVRKCVAACIETSQTFGGGSVTTSCCVSDRCNISSMTKFPLSSRIFIFLFIIFNFMKQVY